MSVGFPPSDVPTLTYFFYNPTAWIEHADVSVNGKRKGSLGGDEWRGRSEFFIGLDTFLVVDMRLLFRFVRVRLVI